MLTSFACDTDRPKAAVSGDVTKESALCVSTAHDDALPWMAFHIDTVRRTILIVRTGDEGLDVSTSAFFMPLSSDSSKIQ